MPNHVKSYGYIMARQFKENMALKENPTGLLGFDFETIINTENIYRRSGQKNKVKTIKRPLIE